MIPGTRAEGNDHSLQTVEADLGPQFIGCYCVCLSLNIMGELGIWRNGKFQHQGFN